MKLLVAVLALAVAGAKASPLPECDLSGTTGVHDFKSSPQLVLQAEIVQRLFNVSRKSTGSQAVAKGDAVWVSDLEIVQKNVALRAPQSFKYSANFLAISFSYDPNTPQTSLYRFKARNGDSYHALMYGKDAVFVREDGLLCNRVVRYSSDTSSIVAYTYQTDPEDIKFVFGKEERSWGTGGLRIIFGGVAAGVMQFQEIWTRDGKILSTRTHQFDQFAQDVKIAGLPIHVSNAATDSYMMSIDATEERLLSPDEARTIAQYLRPKTKK